eukprot:NODE_1_length_95616_cov_0.657642.p64 type:complete len:163 gc:universal NODE_1_length_95616_cov_0.657642:8480-8968(+)
MLGVIIDVVNLMGLLYTQTQKMKRNSEELKSLITRVSLLESVLSQIVTIETSKSTDLVLGHVKEVLEEIIREINIVHELNVALRLGLAGGHKENIDKYQYKLDELTMQLNLTFQIDSRVEQFKGSKLMEARMNEILKKTDHMNTAQLTQMVQNDLPEELKKG